MIKTLLVTILVAAIAEQADLVFRDGGNSCTIFKTEGTRTVHSQCDFHSPNVDAEVQDLKERMTRVEARLPATPNPTENPTKNPTKTPSGFTKTGDGMCRTSGKEDIRGFRKNIAQINPGLSNAELQDLCNAECAKTAVCIGTTGYLYNGVFSTCHQHVSSKAAWLALPTYDSSWTEYKAGCTEGCVVSDSPDDVWVHPGAGWMLHCYKKDIPPTQAPTDTPTVEAVSWQGTCTSSASCTVKGEVTTLAGGAGKTSYNTGSTDGTDCTAVFNNPYDMTYSPDGSTVAVVDASNNAIRMISMATGEVTTLAGSGFHGHGNADGIGSAASFSFPQDNAYSPDGSTLAVADTGNHRIRMINVATREVTTLAGNYAGYHDGTGSAALFSGPRSVEYSPDGTTIAVADKGNNRVRLINVATKAVTTLAGSSSLGLADGIGSAAMFKYPCTVAYSPDGSTLAVTDQKNHCVRLINVATGAVTTLAGSGSKGYADGIGSVASFKDPIGVDYSPDGSTLAIGDSQNFCVRLINVATKEVTTLAGSRAEAFADGIGSAASFANAADVAYSPDGSTIGVADISNNRIREICTGI